MSASYLSMADTAGIRFNVAERGSFQLVPTHATPGDHV
jgi:hypothetical protein